MNQRRFAVLDRDGTVIVERHYLSDPAAVELLPGAAAGLRRLRRLGLGLVLVTNQSGVGRGYFDEPMLGRVHQRLVNLLAAEGVRLDGIYHCPHEPAAACDCRKPRPGLVCRAAADLGFDPAAAFVIGDKPCDLGLGRAVGATTILVRTGYGQRFAAEVGSDADYIVDNIDRAADIVAAKLAETRLAGPTPEGAPIDRMNDLALGVKGVALP